MDSITPAVGNDLIFVKIIQSKIITQLFKQLMVELIAKLASHRWIFDPAYYWPLPSCVLQSLYL